MPTITDHMGSALNNCIEITADARNLENGNGSHVYDINVYDENHVRILGQNISFQDGPLKVAGHNGITDEALLAICIDRLTCFQSSKYACKENEHALSHIEEALHWLQSRTAKRQQRGVEGTHAV